MKPWQATLIGDDGMQLLRCAARDCSQAMIRTHHGLTIVEWNDVTGKVFAARWDDYQAMRCLTNFYAWVLS